jgi:hypothetical protein
VYLACLYHVMLMRIFYTAFYSIVTIKVFLFSHNILYYLN